MSEEIRHWDSELQEWIYFSEVSDALDAAVLAIDSYYNDDRESAIRWLLKAHRANKATKKERA